MGAYVNGKKTVTADVVTATDLATTGEVLLGDTSPLLASSIRDKDAWIAGTLQIGMGIISQAQDWGTSLFTVPSTGFGTTHVGTCNFDYTGGTHENLLTKESAVGAAFDFTTADVGKVIIMATGSHPGAIALIEQFVSTTQVVLSTCGWDADIATGSMFVLCDEPLSFTSPQLKINNVGANCVWTNRSYAHTATECTKLYAEAAAAGVTNLLVDTVASGYTNVDSIIVEHETGAIVSGNIQNVIRIAIDDSDASAGASLGCIRLTRGGTSITNRTDGIRIGTSFKHAVHIDGSVATDPYYSYTFVSGYATVTNRSNLGAGITLANDLRTKLLAHAADDEEHFHGGGATPDIVNFAAMPAASTDLATLITLVSYELTGYAAHHTDALAAGGGSYHNGQFPDATGTLTSAVAPTTMDECITRLNDLRAKYNIHDSNTTAHTHGSEHQIALTALTGDGSFINAANNVQMFTSNTTGIVIGSDAPFSVVSYTAQVAASASITPTFQYSTGAGLWATLPVSDSTAGFTLTGKIAFSPPADWAVSAWAGGVGVGEITNAYYVRILRTRATLGTPPTENLFKIYAGGSATDMYINGDGSITPGYLADASAANDTIYYSTTASKLVFKDSTGTVRNLY